MKRPIWKLPEEQKRDVESVEDEWREYVFSAKGQIEEMCQVSPVCSSFDSASSSCLWESYLLSSHLPQALHAWNSLRQTRMAGVRRYASGNANMLVMKDGPEQQQRDAAWGAMTRAWKNELEELGEEGVKRKEKPKAKPDGDGMRSPGMRMYVFGYDAAGEAERCMEGVFA